MSRNQAEHSITVGTYQNPQQHGSIQQQQQSLNEKQDLSGAILQQQQQQQATGTTSLNQSQQQITINSTNSVNTAELQLTAMMHQKLHNDLQIQQSLHHHHQSSIVKNDINTLMSLGSSSSSKKKIDGIAMLQLHARGESYHNQIGVVNDNQQLLSSGGKPKCPECGKIYSNNSNLKQHIVNVHTVQTEYISCHVCNKQFKTKQYLQIHLLSMHGIRKRKSYPVYQIQNNITNTSSTSSQHAQQYSTSSRWPEDKH